MAAKSGKKRAPLSKERVFETAVRLADEEGVEALTMRKLAQKLGVEAMSLYHHVADKEAILDGMVEAVFGEMELPQESGWKPAMRARCNLLRETLLRHPWAASLLDSRRSPGPATLSHLDWVLGSLRDGGFSVDMAAHGIALLDSYVYGFVIQEIALPINDGEPTEEMAAEMAAAMPANMFPNLMEMAQEVAMQPGYAFAREFPFGLELILDGLDRARKTEAKGKS